MAKEQFRKSETDEVFTLVRNKKGNIVIVAGGYQVVENEFKTFKEAENFIASKPYKLIFNTILIMLNYAEEQKKNAAKDEKDAASN